jgi:hypothetical protein
LHASILDENLHFARGFTVTKQVGSALPKN